MLTRACILYFLVIDYFLSLVLVDRLSHICSMGNESDNHADQGIWQTSGKVCWIAWAYCGQELFFWNSTSLYWCRNGSRMDQIVFWTYMDLLTLHKHQRRTLSVTYGTLIPWYQSGVGPVSYVNILWRMSLSRYMSHM